METYEIRLCGYPLKLKTKHNKETLEFFKSEVEEKIKAIQDNHQNISIEKALFLTCLSFAEDRFFLKKAINKNLDRLESKAKSVLKGLESSSKNINFEKEK
ncbi:MAG: cell division protein ZapA [Bdellovibrionales bacterium]